MVLSWLASAKQGRCNHKVAPRGMRVDQAPDALAQARHGTGVRTGMTAVGRPSIHLVQQDQGPTRGTGWACNKGPESVIVWCYELGVLPDGCSHEPIINNSSLPQGTPNPCHRQITGV